MFVLVSFLSLNIVLKFLYTGVAVLQYLIALAVLGLFSYG